MKLLKSVHSFPLISCLHKPPNCPRLVLPFCVLLFRLGMDWLVWKEIHRLERAKHKIRAFTLCITLCMMLGAALPLLSFYLLQRPSLRHGQCCLFCCCSQITTLIYHKSACMFATLLGEFVKYNFVKSIFIRFLF